MTSDWLLHFPLLAALPPAERDLLQASVQFVALPSGSVVFAPGAPAAGFVLVLEGTVRVQKVSASGRELVLYRVSGGESCILTTACLLSGQHYQAEAVAETPVVHVAVIPQAAFDQLMGGSADFRRFVFTDYSSRITDLLQVVEEVAFERVDRRLAQRLLDRADTAGCVHATHQHLAAELGSAREVVSRQLKEFQRRGWVRLARGRIELTARTPLADLAGGGL